MQMIAPIDVVALVQAIFTGVAAVGGVFATVYAIWAKRSADAAAAKSAENAAQIKAVATQIDGLLVDRDKAKVKEGEAAEKIKGAETAATLAEGRQLGMDEARAASGGADKPPLPVADDRTATGVERAADAQERAADAQERTADAAETRK